MSRILSVIFMLLFTSLGIGIEVCLGPRVLGLTATLCAFLLVVGNRGSLLAPSCVFAFTYWLFLVSRHALWDLGLAPTDVVTASTWDPHVFLLYRCILAASLPLIGLSYSFLGHVSVYLYSSVSKFGSYVEQMAYVSRKYAIGGMLWSGPALCISVIGMAKLISQSGYESALVSEDVEHFSSGAYTCLKWSWIFVAVTFLKNRKITFIFAGVFLCFLSATLFSGLRGYFFLYLVFCLVFFDGLGFFKMKLSYAVALVIGGLVAATILLEYRIGFTVSEGTLLSKVSAGLWSQGVTTEVFYGAIEQGAHVDFLRNVLFQGWGGNEAFGYVLDRLRGISYAGKGGLASSGFAEAFSGGWVTYCFVLFFLGVVLRFLDICFKDIRYKPINVLILFFSFPAVAYFPRGSLTPLLTKALIIAGFATVSRLYASRSELLGKRVFL